MVTDAPSRGQWISFVAGEKSHNFSLPIKNISE
jgi:hypothetical protein